VNIKAQLSQRGRATLRVLCYRLFCIVFEIKRVIDRKFRIFHTAPAFDGLVKGDPVGISTKRFVRKKTRMWRADHQPTMHRMTT